MPETGLYLRAHLGADALRKTIILVGSLVPLGEPGSDAPGALEFAVAKLRDRTGRRLDSDGRATLAPGRGRKRRCQRAVCCAR